MASGVWSSIMSEIVVVGKALSNQLPNQCGFYIAVTAQVGTPQRKSLHHCFPAAASSWAGELADLLSQLLLQYILVWNSV